MSKKSILITGCSDGGLGSALAKAFHTAGLRVLATARNPSKMASLSTLGIETLTLDVNSQPSISACVEQVTSLLSNSNGLDYILNNAGGGYSMPVSDLDLDKVRELFELNVFSYIAVTNAFLPLILQSSTKVIINQTSVAAVVTPAFTSTYCASKAAMSMMSNLQRLELGVFGVKVVELRTGQVKSNFFQNWPVKLPQSSLFQVARDVVERQMNGLELKDGMEADEYARRVVGDILQSNPPRQIWRGYNATVCWLTTFLPGGWVDEMLKGKTGIDKVEEKVAEMRKVQ